MPANSLRIALAAATLAATLAPGLAVAQSRYYSPRLAGTYGYDDGYGFNPNEGPQPNGCVKWCPLDDSPCDPPQFKQTDGRCAYHP